MSTRKRKLDFRSAEDVILEIQRLRTGGYTKLKRWNLTQICEHLIKTMEGEMNGLGFRIPWVLRKTVGSWLTVRVLESRSMPSVPTLPSLKPTDVVDGDDPAIVEQCINTLRKAESFSGRLDNYPFVDGLSHDQWRQFMWIHASHHLGFLAPSDQQHEET